MILIAKKKQPMCKWLKDRWMKKWGYLKYAVTYRIASHEGIPAQTDNGVKNSCFRNVQPGVYGNFISALSVSSKAFVVIYILRINCSVSLLTTCAYMLRLFVILLLLWTDSWCIKYKDVLFSKVDPLLVRWSLDDLSSDKTCLIPIGTLPSIILQYSNINSSCMSSIKLPCSFFLR